MTLRLDRTIAALALIALCGPALAQQPTQEQINANGPRPSNVLKKKRIKSGLLRLL